MARLWLSRLLATEPQSMCDSCLEQLHTEFNPLSMKTSNEWYMMQQYKTPRDAFHQENNKRICQTFGTARINQSIYSTFHRSTQGITLR